MKVYRVEVMVIDFDNIGPGGVKDVIEHTRYPNWAIHPEVKGIDTREVNWSDRHPLNIMDTADQAYRDLFGDHVPVLTADLKGMASFACEHVVRGEESCDEAEMWRGACCNACWARRVAEEALRKNKS